MTIYPDSVGEFDAEGHIKVEARNCALTGVPVLLQHHTMQMLDATHFVRVVSQQYPKLTDDVCAALLASLSPKQGRQKAADAAKEA